MKYDKYEDRFELRDTVLYDNKKWRIISRSYQPNDRFGLVNIDNDNERIEVDVNNVQIENLELKKSA